MNNRIIRPLGLALVMAVAAACTSTNPYTGEQQTSKTTKGAAIGAAAGAVAGVLAGDDAKERRNRALAGATAGALAGGAVGNYMDRQEQQLRARLQGTGVSVTRVGDNIILNMPGNITFQTGNANINSSFYAVLDSVALVAQEYDKTIIEVAGHTDATGSAEFNQQLSQQRANSVAQYLISQQLLPGRIAVIGYGETRPIASNDTDAGRAQNRRVEIRLIPNTVG